MSLSIFSGLAPALRATGVSPIFIVREGRAVTWRVRRTRGMAIAGVAVIAAAAALGRQPPVLGFPFLGYACALLLIVGFGLLGPAFTQFALGFLSGALVVAVHL